MARQTKPETKLSEAADKATALLQGLQSRLNGQRAENSEDLDRQLREYFVSSEASTEVGVLNQIRERVIEVVADRILESWESGDRPEFRELESQVIDRVAERILERMTKR